MNEELDVNVLVNGLLDQIAQQAKQMALLTVQLQMAQKAEEPNTELAEEGGE